MRTWKDKVKYNYPSCQTITLQGSEGRRFRLKLEIVSARAHQRYNDAANELIACSMAANTEFFYVLNVTPKPKLHMRKQFNPLNRDYGTVFPIMHGKDGQGADLIEVAKLCEMIPLGPVTKVYYPKEAQDGSERDAQTPARAEASGQASPAQAAEGIRDGQNREVREPSAAPQAGNTASGAVDRSFHSWDNSGTWTCPSCPGGNCIESMVNHDERRCVRCRPQSLPTFTVAS